MQTITAPQLRTDYRVRSIDLLRGLVMIIMALDHVRDYFSAAAFQYDPLDLSQTSTALFLTRWITHFCAPIFVFLSGTSAFLVGQRKGKKELSAFLFKRGLWLVLLEVTVVFMGWLFAPPFTSALLLQVIWALGISMIALSLIVLLPKNIILIVGIILVAGHNGLDNVHEAGNDFKAIGWHFLHDPGLATIDRLKIFFAYPVLPWIGLMTLGYSLGNIYIKNYDAAKRKKLLRWLGVAAILTFIILRYTNIYGDANHWSTQQSPTFTFLSFINTVKYPPSLLYVLMTIGPALIFLSFTENPINRFQKVISVYGRVPLFYYLLHIYLIHFFAVIAAQLSGYKWSDMFLNTWVSFSPDLKGYGFNLATVYAVWALVIILLYPLCRWYDKYKTSHKEKWWLSYL